MLQALMGKYYSEEHGINDPTADPAQRRDSQCGAHVLLDAPLYL